MTRRRRQKVVRRFGDGSCCEAAVDYDVCSWGGRMQRRSSSVRAVVIAWSFGGGGGRRFLHFPPLLQSIELASDRSTGSMKKGPAGFAFLRIGWPSEEEEPCAR